MLLEEVWASLVGKLSQYPLVVREGTVRFWAECMPCKRWARNWASSETPSRVQRLGSWGRDLQQEGLSPCNDCSPQLEAIFATRDV